jgi:cyanophycinase-like exopeptidase
MRPCRLVLSILVCAAASASAAEPPRDTVPVRELFLAGGSLAVCSDLAPRACTKPPVNGRPPPAYRLDEAGIAAARSPALWAAPDAPSPDAIAALLETTRGALGARASDPAGLSAATLEGALQAVSPWPTLLDAERLAVLAALELPAASVDGQRKRERADPAASAVRGGVQVLKAFVGAARARAGGRPRIAVVTASAFDPMEPVDFYRSLFEALGADARWWPVDAAVAAARFGAGDCDALARLRLERLRLARREVVFPDLAAEQLAFCRTAGASLAGVHGVFFAGGDQWRLRQAFFGADERPNPWLQELRAAHAGGRLVVGGTSAGAAVQSASWMLTNGDVATAVAQPHDVRPPPEPGCGRAKRCGGQAEDALGLWPRGGLGLAADAIVDTHFSERARELRLLRAMQAASAAWGYGADETSALHLREASGRREIRALGEHGGWVLHRPPGTPDDAALAWYLVPGAMLVIEGEAVRLVLDAGARAARPHDATPPASAFEPGALRALAQALAAQCDGARRLPAGTASASLHCQPDTRGWRGPGAVDGVGPLRLRLRSAPDHANVAPRDLL